MDRLNIEENDYLKKGCENRPLPVIWFALPAVPQPGIDATTGVAEPPLMAFLELQTILLFQLILVVREALQIYIFNFFASQANSIYSIAMPAIRLPKLVFSGPKSNTMF